MGRYAALLLLCLLLAGCGASGAPRPDPDLLVFEVAGDYDEGAYKLMAVRADGRGLRTLIGRAANEPVWSPDGRHIAFNLYPDLYSVGSLLHVMNADGTHARQLVPAADGDSYVVGWSPDSKRVLYSLTESGGEHVYRGLWVVGIDGRGKRRLAAEGYGAAWSPDGSTIALVSGDTRKDGVHLLDVREGRMTLLVRHAGSPRWTPDGKRIVFRRVEQGRRSGIYIVGRDGGSPRLLERLGKGEDPALGNVSPDGSWVLVSYHPAISRLSLDDGELQKLTTDPRDLSPDWSPDGKRIAFERTGNIWVMDADGRHARLIARASRLAVYMAPTWRP